MNKKNKNRKHKFLMFGLIFIALSFLFVVKSDVFALFGHEGLGIREAQAQVDWLLPSAQDMTVFFYSALIEIFKGLIWVLSVLSWLIMKGLGIILNNQEFIYFAPVVTGWVVVRDLANSFFVLVMIVIGIGTILNIPNFSYKQMLGKLVIAAILVNFSRLIAGVFIDFGQILMLTFFKAIEPVFEGSIWKSLQINALVSYDAPAGTIGGQIGDTAQALIQTLMNSVGAFFFLLIIVVILAAYLVVMILRMVMLWILVILSPIPYVLNLLPRGQTYGQQWWNQFINYVILGPLLAFFLWLSIVIASNPLKIPAYSSPGSQGLTSIFKLDNFLRYTIAVIVLFAGLYIGQQVAGLAGGVLAMAGRVAKGALKVGTGYAAAAWAGRRVKQVAGGIGKGLAATAMYKVGGGKMMEKIAIGKPTGLTAKVMSMMDSKAGQVFRKASGFGEYIDKKDEMYGFSAKGRNSVANKGFQDIKNKGEDAVGADIKKVEKKVGANEKLSMADSLTVRAHLEMGGKLGEDTKEATLKGAYDVAADTKAAGEGTHELAAAFTKAATGGKDIGAAKTLLESIDEKKMSKHEGATLDEDGYWKKNGEFIDKDGEVVDKDKAKRSTFDALLDAGKIDKSKLSAAQLADKGMMKSMSNVFGDRLGQVLDRYADTDAKKKAAQGSLSGLLEEMKVEGKGLLNEEGDLGGHAEAFVKLGGSISKFEQFADGRESARLAVSDMNSKQVRQQVRNSKGNLFAQNAIGQGLDTRNVPKTGPEVGKALEWAVKAKGADRMKPFTKDSRTYSGLAKDAIKSVDGEKWNNQEAVESDKELLFSHISKLNSIQQSKAISGNKEARDVVTNALDSDKASQARDIVINSVSELDTDKFTGPLKTDMANIIEKASVDKEAFEGAVNEKLESIDGSIKKATDPKVRQKLERRKNRLNRPSKEKESK